MTACPNKKPQRHGMRQHGISMVEVVISIILVSTLMLVTMQASSSVLQMEQEDRSALFAAEVIEAFANEITSRDFQDRDAPIFGLETGESASTRTDFDDIDDYHDQTISPPTYRDSEIFPGTNGWSIAFIVSPAEADGTILPTHSAAVAPLRRIQLILTTSNSQTFVETVWVSNTPTDFNPWSPFQRMRIFELDFTNGETLRKAVPMRNLPETNSWE